MAKLVDLGGTPVNAGEIEAIQYFKANLPDNYLLYPNVEIPQPNGPALEYDLVVVAPHAVYAIEIKDWHGTIIGKDNYDWAIGRSTRKNPVKSINYKAKVLQGRIEKYGPAYREIWVESLVVIVSPHTVLSLQGECAKKTLLLHKATDFVQKPKLLNTNTSTPVAPDTVKNALDIVKKAVGEDGAHGRSKQPLKFNQYEVVETLHEEEGLTEYLAKNILVASNQRMRLRVFEVSAYLHKDEAQRRRLLITHEYKMAQEIGFHQNLLPVTELFELDGNKIIEVTGWNEEGTLARLLVEQRPLTTGQKLELVRGMLYGLAALHRKGILHRAIAPSNILLGENLTPRLMNFDRARLDSPGLKTPQYTVWQMPLEAEEQAYLSPELAEVNYKAYPSSDLYSLGVVCFEVLTGLRPVDSPRDALRPNFPDMKVSEFVQGLPAGIDNFINKMLQPDPARRFKEAEEALSEFDKITQPDKIELPSSSALDESSQTPIRKDYKPNDVIEGQYRVVGELGRGGSSRVYKVYNYLHDRQYAMKIINEGVQIGRLQKEFQTLSSLDHPNITRAIWAGQIYQGQYYLVTELVEGESFSDYTEGQQRMSVAEAVDMMKELLNALEYLHTPQAHRPSILHRDIKPSNLMRTKHSLKVIDFNIATQLNQASQTMVGTIGYVAPDVVTSGWDASCDLFSAGVVLYQLITRHHPFEDVTQLTSQVQPHDPRQFVPELSATFAAFLVKACMPLRQHRFESAAEMQTALLQSKPYLQSYQKPLTDGLARLIPVSPEELARPNYNPYVTRFLTLYSQARRSNRGTRGLDDVARATYVPTLLDQRLQPAILEGEYRLVIITGNAGDGKTAFIQNLEAQVRAAGQPFELLPNSNGSRFVYNGYTFITNYDGSQDEGENINDHVLSEFFAPYSGPAPQLPEKEIRLIAINEGRLRDFLEIERDSFQWLREHGLKFFDEVETGQLPGGLLMVNLNWRSIVAGAENSIFSRQLKVFSDDSFWQPCENCAIKDRCFIKFNADTFRDQVNGSEVAERLRTLFETVHLRRRLHITMRDMRSALSYTIFRDHTCDDVAQALAIANTDPTTYLSNFYYNVLIGQDALEIQQVGTTAVPINTKS